MKAKNRHTFIVTGKDRLKDIQDGVGEMERVKSVVCPPFTDLPPLLKDVALLKRLKSAEETKPSRKQDLEALTHAANAAVQRESRLSEITSFKSHFMVSDTYFNWPVESSSFAS